MTLSAAPPRALARALAAAATLLVLAAPARATDPEVANFDARPVAPVATPPGGRARDDLRERLGRLGALSVDKRTGTLRSVGRLDGYLTGPSGRDGADVALGYVREHATAFGVDGSDLGGLRLVDRSFANGVEHLRWEQRYGGVPIADAGLNAAVTGAGRLLTVSGPPAADVAVRSLEPAIGARAAYRAARRSVLAAGDVPAVAKADSGAQRRTSFEDGGYASLALYRSGAAFRLAWRVLAPVSSTGVYDLLIDARSGAILRRANRVNFANAKVFRYTPADGFQDNLELSGWLDGSGTLSGPNVHAFADVHDVVPFRPGSTTYDLTPEAGSEVAGDASGNFEFPLTTVDHYSFPWADKCPNISSPPPTSACTWDPRSPSTWAANRAQSVTQLFYLVNVFADHLRTDPDILFTDDGFRRTANPLGNPNAPADPTASDPVLAQALDGADSGAGAETPEVPDGFPDREHRNNANFLTLPDGQPGLMQMYLWTPRALSETGVAFNTPYGAYDGANDASVVFHEYAHGLSNRLVADGAGFGALNTTQAGALGEGISDFYAMDYLVKDGLQDDDTGPDVRLGRYLDNGLAGAMRWQPLDCEPVPATDPVVPECIDVGPDTGASARRAGLTYADFGKIESGPEIHADGEIWAQTLWSVRRTLAAQHPADGMGRARWYLTEALRIVPDEPSFLDLRNAMLEVSPDEDDPLLWQVFASRGMGYFAATEDSDDAAPIADFTAPADLTGAGSISGTVDDEDAKPVAGARVAVAGHDTGLGPDHSAVTGPDGDYTIAGVPATGSHRYPLVRASKPGYLADREVNVEVPASGTRILTFQLERDWSSLVGGGRVDSFTGPDNTPFGCGPAGLIDDDPRTVWGSSRSSAGPTIVIELAAPVDVARVAIDPGAGCGDDQTAALGAYEVLASGTPGGEYRALVSGVFGANDVGSLRDAFSGEAQAVRYLMVHAKAPQSTLPNTSGEAFIDVAELHVAKVPGSPVGAAAETLGATAIGATTATLAGTVVPHGGTASLIFEYGPTTAYGATVAAGDTGSAQGPVPALAAVGGLQPSTSYHFRIVALRDGRRYEGADSTFATAAPPPDLPQPKPPVTGSLARIMTSKVHATRKGMFKIKVAFAAAAPAGTARVRALVGKGKQLALASFTVRPGRTVTKTLRLNRAGRKAIKPGKSRRVTIELRLPGGRKVKKTVTLARNRR